MVLETADLLTFSCSRKSLFVLRLIGDRLRGGRRRNCYGFFGKFACICMHFEMHITGHQQVMEKEGARNFPPFSSYVLLFSSFFCFETGNRATAEVAGRHWFGRTNKYPPLNKIISLVCRYLAV